MSNIGVGFGVMILNNKNEILLGKRHGDPKKASSLLHGEGSWTMPGGKLHFKESFEQGAYREVLEETGLKIDKGKLKLIALNNDIVEDAHFITIGLLSKNFTGELETKEPDEIIEWQWFDFNDLPKPLYFPSGKVINNYKKKSIYIK